MSITLVIKPNKLCTFYKSSQLNTILLDKLFISIDKSLYMQCSDWSKILKVKKSKYCVKNAM